MGRGRKASGLSEEQKKLNKQVSDRESKAKRRAQINQHLDQINEEIEQTRYGEALLSIVNPLAQLETPDVRTELLQNALFDGNSAEMEQQILNSLDDQEQLVTEFGYSHDDPTILEDGFGYGGQGMNYSAYRPLTEDDEQFQEDNDQWRDHQQEGFGDYGGLAEEEEGYGDAEDEEGFGDELGCDGRGTKSQIPAALTPIGSPIHVKPEYSIVNSPKMTLKEVRDDSGRVTIDLISGLIHCIPGLLIN